MLPFVILATESKPKSLARPNPVVRETSMIAIYREYASTSSNKTEVETLKAPAILEGAGGVGELCEGVLIEVYWYHPNGTS